MRAANPTKERARELRADLRIKVRSRSKRAHVNNSNANIRADDVRVLFQFVVAAMENDMAVVDDITPA